MRKIAPQMSPPAKIPTDNDDQGTLVANRDAFSELYAAHANSVYRYLLSRTGSIPNAEELTSRTFVNAFTNLGSFRGHGKFESWLMTIAHNLLANWFRDRGRRPPTTPLDEALQIPSEVPGPELTLEAQEETLRVRAATAALAPERQRLITLKYVDGLTNAEIGQIIGRSEGAVKALHHRTLRQLQKALSHEAV
jgi:RNA polymerase sigma-70 factor (ECF subfamily)